MNFVRLEKNLIDIIAEQQIKLGYRKEQVELYYPEHSLKNLLGIDGNVKELYKAFDAFLIEVMPRFGEIRISNKAERFCIVIPPEGSEYVHTLIKSGNMPGISFLNDFITVICRHNLTIEDITPVFLKYSPKVRVEKIEDESFEYLIYFEDGFPDEYRYCISFEGSHAIYHRFIEEDYKEFGFATGFNVYI